MTSGAGTETPTPRRAEPVELATADSTARADFLTAGVTLDTGESHSVFDGDGSAIIVHERPDPYAEEESDTGSRLACGVIVPTDEGG